MFIRIGFTLLFLVTMAQVISSLKHDSVVPYRGNYRVQKNTGSKKGGKKSSTAKKLEPSHPPPSQKQIQIKSARDSDPIYVSFNSEPDYHWPGNDAPEDDAIVFEITTILGEERERRGIERGFHIVWNDTLAPGTTLELNQHSLFYWGPGMDCEFPQQNPSSYYICELMYEPPNPAMDVDETILLAAVFIWRNTPPNIGNPVFEKHYNADLRQHVRFYRPRREGD
ncbi:hypothetical protein C8R42DRAFT_666164 [Lentinula raphanica]|nr:hypothetical protein C8R42DRAFT_666164 [Lentinula raphanica]